MEDRRAEPRRRALKGGKIVFNDLNSVYDCKIRELTEGGARLRIDRPWRIPQIFEFIDTTGKARRPAHVVWRGENEIGIAFD